MFLLIRYVASHALFYSFVFSKIYEYMDNMPKCIIAVYQCFPTDGSRTSDW